MVRSLLIAFALLWLVPSAGAQSVFDLPLTGRVMDRAELLSPTLEATLDEQLRQHEASTSNQVVVLTIPSLEGRTVEEVANRLFNRWGLGQADRDNGVLLLIARNDRELRIEVGRGLEGDLTDAEAGRIIRNVIVPSFRSDDYEGGITSGVSAILGTIEGTYEPPSGGEESGEDAPWWVALIFLVSHVLVPVFIAVRALVNPPVERYLGLIFSLFFLGPMFLIFAGFFLAMLEAFQDPELYFPIGLALLAVYILGWFALDLYMSRSVKWQNIRHQVRKAKKSGKSTKIDAGWISFSAGGSSSSGGGGGFSGGGGSSGGGGASGSW